MSFSSLASIFLYSIIFVQLKLCSCDIFDNEIESKSVFEFEHVKPKLSLEEQNLAVQSLLERVLGEDKAKYFNATVFSALASSDNDVFHIFKKGGSVVSVEGSSAVAVVSGIHYYLKNYLNCHISWDYNQLNFPSALPDVDVSIKYPERFRLFQNVCTASYSYVWWDWSRWEKEIDRWALNGINLAYASTGQEAVWMKIYKQIGMNESEIHEYFTGPAFLAWNRMGNIRGWQGPLSDDWHTSQSLLQRRILSRMRQLSITPILPAFSGIVPQAFQRLFPNANLTKSPCWNHFEDKYCCVLVLDPTDPLFKTIGSKFLREMIAQFGTNNVYSADTFNENRPQFESTEYLANVGRGIYGAMTNVDSQAIWVLQGWIFVNEVSYWTKDRVKAFLTSVPLGKILVLDLFAEQMPAYDRLEYYFGQPYIWCMLHNFGGTLGMQGSLPDVNEGVKKARTEQKSLVGLGMTPEGINQNYVVYDFMSSVFSSTDSIELGTWFENYAKRRYGAEITPDMIKSWQILKDTVYSYNGSFGALHGQYKLCTRPSLTYHPSTWYNTSLVFEAWRLLLSHQINASNYKHDVVDLTRECLQTLFELQFEKLWTSVQNNNLNDFKTTSERLVSILKDLENVLASEEHFLLGVWLKSARSAAANTLEQHLFEANARNQITLWGPQGQIRDYATKQWAGMVSQFYLPRWTLFLSQVQTSLTPNSTFNQSKYNDDVFHTVETPFTLSINPFPDNPTGNSYEIAKKIYATWKDILP